MLPYKHTIEPYLQTFQYKIINRLLNCNEKLFTWKVKSSNKCVYCECVDTIEHHLYYCKQSTLLWNKLLDWFSDNFDIHLKLTVCEVLFGIPNNTIDEIEILNYCIILAKWYINKSRTSEKNLLFWDLLQLIIEKVKLQKQINLNNAKDNLSWQNRLLEVL